MTSGYRGDLGEYPAAPARKLNYAIDLDGCLAEWAPSDGFYAACGAWVEDAQEALRELLADRDTGTVLVHTCRATWPAGGGWHAVAEFLWSGGFRVAIVTEDEPDGTDSKTIWTLVDSALPDGPTIGIWLGRGKPVAHVYIDDRVVRFDKKVGWRRTIVNAKAVALEIPL